MWWGVQHNHSPNSQYPLIRLQLLIRIRLRIQLPDWQTLIVVLCSHKGFIFRSRCFCQFTLLQPWVWAVEIHRVACHFRHHQLESRAFAAAPKVVKGHKRALVSVAFWVNGELVPCTTVRISDVVQVKAVRYMIKAMTRLARKHDVDQFFCTEWKTRFRVRLVWNRFHITVSIMIRIYSAKTPVRLRKLFSKNERTENEQN